MSLCNKCEEAATNATDLVWICTNKADDLPRHKCESKKNPSLVCQCAGVHNSRDTVCQNCILAAIQFMEEAEYGAPRYPAVTCVVDGDILPPHDCQARIAQGVSCWCSCTEQAGLLAPRGSLTVCSSCNHAASHDPKMVDLYLDGEDACIRYGNTLPEHHCRMYDDPEMCWCRCSHNRSTFLCRYCIFEAKATIDYDGEVLPEHDCEANDDLSVLCQCQCNEKRPRLVCEDCFFYVQEYLIHLGLEYDYDPQWVCINQADEIDDHNCSAEEESWWALEDTCLCTSHGRKNLCDKCFSVAMHTARTKRIDPVQVCADEGDQLPEHSCESEHRPWETCLCLCRGHDPIQLCEECFSAAKPTATSYRIDPKRVCTEPGWGIPEHTCDSMHYDSTCQCSCQRIR